jgi:hypothetical protein
LFEFAHIERDLWNILTLIDRLDWMRSAAVNGVLDRVQWSEWPALDIEHFHIELRSIFDYLAIVFLALAAQPKSMPKEKSFRKLTQWLAKGCGNRKYLSEDLAEVVLGAPRFPNIRSVRDATVHHGGQTIVFAKPEDGILFQVNHKWRWLVSKSEATHDNDLVDFRFYASRVLTDMYLFLDRAACVLRQMVGSPDRVSGGRDYHTGYSTLIHWIELESDGMISSTTPA